MSAVRIATRYAKSLIGIAGEHGKLDGVMEDIQSFDSLSRVREFYLLMKSPIVKADKKGRVLDQLLKGRFDDLTMQFIHLLLRKGREALMPEIAKEFIVAYKKRRNITTVKVTAAARLSEAALAAIRQRLQEAFLTGATIEMETRVEPGLIGGFCVEFDGNQFDATVIRRLDELRKEFRDNLYISQIIAS